jgi:hypothetical protein
MARITNDHHMFFGHLLLGGIHHTWDLYGVIEKGGEVGTKSP